MTQPSSSAPTSRVAPRPRRPRAAGRIALLGLAGVSLLSGLDAALLLLGVWAPVESTTLPGLHGMVMALGFMGTVIALERAQSLGRPWAYAAPVVIGAASSSLVVGVQPIIGKLLLIEGYLLFTAVYLALWRRAPVANVAVQVLSSVMAMCAAGLWLRVEVEHLIVLLAGFIICTIAAERAELAQLTMGPRAPRRLLGLSAALVIAALTALLVPAVGMRIFGLVVLTFAAWLARDDVARRFLRTTGLRRYNAAALLAGYLWLGCAGAAWLVAGTPTAHWAYDITIHGTFLGFGVSMIMAHAPIIFPAVLGRPLPYKAISWGPLALLHLGVAVRFLGNLTDRSEVFRVGAVLSVLALVAFLLVSVILVVTHRADSPR